MDGWMGEGGFAIRNSQGLAKPFFSPWRQRTTLERPNKLALFSSTINYLQTQHLLSAHRHSAAAAEREASLIANSELKELLQVNALHRS
jgi:hypothetical protein